VHRVCRGSIVFLEGVGLGSLVGVFIIIILGEGG